MGRVRAKVREILGWEVVQGSDPSRRTILSMFPTELVSHAPMSWLKSLASRNMLFMSATELVSQLEMSLLNFFALLNSDPMSVTPVLQTFNSLELPPTMVGSESLSTL